MAQDNRVVSIGKQGGADRHSLPSVLVRLRDASGRSMRDVLSDLFDRADDVLFNMADKAGTNHDQTAYFDAMRELRLRRKSMSLSILQYMGRAFNELGRFDPRPASDEISEVDQDSLSLVGHDEVEQQVAIDNLINKLRNRHRQAIRLLLTRFEHVCPEYRLAERQMPLSPEVICSGLAGACEDLDIDIRARLVVLKLFDRLLVTGLDQLYRDANDLLVRENILPEMKEAPTGQPRQSATRGAPPPRRGPAASEGPSSGEGGGAPVSSGSDYSFSELTSLLHQGEASGPGAAGGAGMTLGTEDLMRYLAALQTGESADNKRPLAQQVAQALPGQSSGLDEVQQVDADVINLVTMLFDFILEDRQLPDAIKALIGRLQIPVLKVALVDRSFFNRGGHPARRLLNELAMAGIGWNPRAEGQRDPLREKIESVVERLVNEFTDNVELFSELLEEFTHFMDLDRRRRELVEQRLRDAEEGRARQERARQQAEDALQSVREQYRLPDVLIRLLDGPLIKVLEFVALRDGEDSEAWDESVALANRVAWSVDPRPVESGTRDQLLREIPGIVDQLRNSLHGISWDPFECDALIRDLELAHVDTLQRLEVEGPVDDVEPDPVGDLTEVAPPTLEAQQVSSEATVPEASRESEDASAPKGTTVAPDAAADDAPEPEAPAIDAHWYDQARSLRVGSWVELEHEGQRLRCKLAAIIRATGKYIFVNRNGAKVSESGIDGVAESLANGDISMLDDGLIFDRALESVIGNLRQNRRD
ncbi:uncharacterized protein DUF1631 [Tamilnaduibacter salinus]|uniref:Uncharacterized protein DUF1631 n=1 Tax=Tamilnaduibacter salinus TaxID=1484056 RepID=A0A2U1CT15_9GAMM|nr:DUF1631 domain-containing protein [Tamilnaduibacter salinus]PVY69582.1 uncharacterized protein DUF1631 [Tamilnaduibacter salinus]